jgi:hypothetical protein
MMGIAAGVLGFVSGLFSTHRAVTEIENQYLSTGLGIASSTQAVGGVITVGGYARGNLRAIRIGGVLGRFAGGIATAGLSAHSLGKRIDEKGYKGLFEYDSFTDIRGIAAGVALFVGSALAPWLAVAYLASYLLKDLGISFIQMILGIEGSMFGGQGEAVYDNEHVKK